MNKTELLKLLETWDTLTLLKYDSDGHASYLPILMDIALHGTNRLSWRAAWIADKVNEQHPGIIAPYIHDITRTLAGLNHPGKKRQLLKLVSLYPIGEQNRSFLTSYCLDVLNNSSEPPAVVAHAMQILYHISQHEPGLKEELLEIMEMEIEIHESPGIRARARKIAGLLAKEIRKQRLS